uniref:G-protein coupled receptors family 1 profile domain-containing protein n=1 Tax=Scylla olivacea TaxID=85551 RepID=A0A0P4WAA9_SCYOL
MWPEDSDEESLVPSENPSGGSDEKNDGRRSLNGSLGPYGELTLLRHSLPITVLYVQAYILVMVLGIIGNVLVIMVVVRTRIMRTPVFYFLFNLAFADLLVLVCCVPATLISNVLTRESCRNER